MAGEVWLHTKRYMAANQTQFIMLLKLSMYSHVPPTSRHNKAVVIVNLQSSCCKGIITKTDGMMTIFSWTCVTGLNDYPY